MRISSVLGNITSVGQTIQGPQSIYTGWVSNDATMIAWTPPATQTAWVGDPSAPDYYNIYRNGSLVTTGMTAPPLTNPGVTSNPTVTANQGTTNAPIPWYVDRGPAAGSTNVYTVKAVSGGIESTPSPSASVTFLTNTTSTFPAAVNGPINWEQAFTLPTGNVWIVNQIADVGGTKSWNVPGNASSGTATNNVNCGILYALNNCNQNGGDLIVCQAGLTFPMPGSGLQIPPFTGTNGWTYVISSEDPIYKPAGKLPAYSSDFSSCKFITATCTAAIAATATSTTLTTAWTLKSGWYYVLFNEPTLAPSTITSNTQEERLVLFTQGSTAITWASLNGLYTTAGLTAQANAQILVGYLRGVTPYDRDNGAMANFAFGTIAGGAGILLTYTQGANQQANKVRFVGINLVPSLGVPANQVATNPNYVGISFTNWNFASNPKPWAAFVNTSKCDSIYFDRCIVGMDTNNAAAWVPTKQGILTANCDHMLVNQCYFWGILQNWAATRQDANILIGSGGPIGFQNNYLQCGEENILTGGVAMAPPPDFPHDQTMRCNFSHKPISWLQGFPTLNVVTGWGMFGVQTKDHFEWKGGVRVEVAGNLFLNNWMGAVQSYSSLALILTPRGEVHTTLAPDQWLGWCRNTDFNIHDNLFYNLNIVNMFSNDQMPTAYCARIWLHNNVALVNPFLQGQAPYDERIRAIGIQGPCSDVVIDHNTIICNTHGALGSPSVGTQLGIRFTEVGQAAGSYYLPGPVPYSPNAFDRFQDRFTITNNIIDSGIGTNVAVFYQGGLTLDTYPNLTVNKNITVSDNATWSAASGTNYLPGTTANIAYGSLGLSNFTANNAVPADGANDWTLAPSSPYYAAGTDGKPIGALAPASATNLVNDPFPRTIWQVIQPNNAVMASAAFATNAAKSNAICCGPYLGTPSTTNIETDMGKTFPTIFASIKAQAMANGLATPTRCLHYIDATAQNTTGGSSGPADPTFIQWTNALNTTNWWIRTSYPAGSIVPATNFGDAAGSGLTAVTSQNSILDGTGLTFSQQFARQYDLALRTGQGTTLGYAAGKALAANSLLDGYQFDNQVCSVRSTGAWGMTTASFASGWPNSGNATADAWLQQGEAAQVAAMRAQFPGVIIWANSDYFAHANGNFSYSVTLDPSQIGLYDIVFLQSCIGAPNGIEGQGATTTAQFMANYTAAFAQAAPSGTVMFEQTGRSHGVGWTTVAQTGWVSADWQAARFGLACCVMQNGHYALNSQQNYNPNAPYFMDETLTQGGKFGWLGQPTEAPQTAPRAQGVWWRQFQYGVVFMNPRGNGTQVLNLSALGLGSNNFAIASNGFGDTSINTGLAVSSITLQAGDGRFLIKHF